MTKFTTSKEPLQTDIALDAMTRDELWDALQHVTGISIPALSRASDSAMRSAARSYLRMQKLDPAVILAYFPK